MVIEPNGKGLIRQIEITSLSLSRDFHPKLQSVDGQSETDTIYLHIGDKIGFIGS